MDKNTVLLRDTEAFMRGELDNVTVAQNSIVLDLVQGSYVPYGCYTSAPLPMPLFDALHGGRGTVPRAGGRQLDAMGRLWQVEPLPAPGGRALSGARPRAALA